MNKYCRCDPNISTLLVYYNFDYDFHLMEPEYASSNEGKLCTDPMEDLTITFCSFFAHFTELVPIRDMRQNFLVEDRLEHFDDGTLCGASMFLDRGAECSCLLQDLHHVENVQRKQRQISVDSTDALPKAKAKVIIKKPKVQLPGHVQPISVPSVKPVEVPQEDDDYHDLQASSSNDPSVPLPTTTPTSFMPGDFSQPDQNPSTQGTPEMGPGQDNDDERTEPYDDNDTPVLTEEDIAQLQEEDVDTEPYNSDQSHFVDVDGTVFVPIGPKLHGAPDFGSYDVNGFNQFERCLAKNGKKQPKAESDITQEVLRKYAKEIKQAKFEEFRSFLDFTAMTFRDKRRHKIDNYVTGRWVLTIKVDKDGQFKKFKARWVCRGFQDAQKYDLQTCSPTATRYGFLVASMYWDLLHLDLKTAFLQGETYDLDRRVIHVQLPTDIGLPPYLVGLCTRSVYGLADAPRLWWNRLDKFLIRLAFNQQELIGAPMFAMTAPLRNQVRSLRQRNPHRRHTT